MDLSLLIAIISSVIAVLAIIFGLWAARKYGTRRARLRYEWTSEALLSRAYGSKSNDLEVTYKNIPVPDPHLIRLVVTNVGPRDVPSSAFDQGASLHARANGKIYGILANSHHASRVPAIGADFNIELRPCLLKRGDSWEVSVIASGKLAPKLISPLIDTDILDAAVFDERLAVAGNIWLILAGAFLPMGAVLAAFSSMLNQVFGVPKRRR